MKHNWLASIVLIGMACGSSHLAGQDAQPAAPPIPEGAQASPADPGTDWKAPGWQAQGSPWNSAPPGNLAAHDRRGSSSEALLLINPGDSDGPIRFTCAGRVWTLQPQETRFITGYSQCVVSFFSDGQGGRKNYMLRSGKSYNFYRTSDGWDLKTYHYKVSQKPPPEA